MFDRIGPKWLFVTYRRLVKLILVRPNNLIDFPN